MLIEYYKKDVYGRTLIYIKEQNIKQIIKILTKKETVNKNDLDALELLGHEIKEVLYE